MVETESEIAMKHSSAIQPASVPPPQVAVIDVATLELLAAWKAEDATTDPEKLRLADEEIAELKKGDERKSCGGRRSIDLSVSRFIVLDSGPLGLITHPQRNSEVVAVTE